MKRCLFLPLSLLCLAAAAQNTVLEFDKSVKLCNSIRYSRFENTFPEGQGFSTFASHNWQVFSPTIAYQWKTKQNNFCELELLNLIFIRHYSSFRTSDSAGITVSLTPQGNISFSNFSVRFEYIFNFNKEKTSRWLPGLGLAIAPYARFTRSSLAGPAGLSTQQAFGFATYVVPRLAYALSQRWYADLSIPVAITDFSFIHTRVSNTLLPVQPSASTVSSFSGLPPLYALRIGIGVKI